MNQNAWKASSTLPTAPVLNLNGTSGPALVEEYKNAYRAIREAYEAVNSVTVHGRDFQTAPPGTYEKARAEKVEWLTQLKSIEQAMTDLATDVQKQMKGMNRNRP
jgi:hypothetical protein